jgi:hypothetical protein
MRMNAAADAAYPDSVDDLGRRYVGDDARTFKEAIQVLPHAGEGQLWADNEFVTASDDSGVEVDVAALRNVHGLDIDALEARANRSLEDMVREATPQALVPVDTHKDIIDRRRLALRTLGFDCRYRWQIASDRYEAGDMRRFFKRKIAACEQHGCADAFGWIRHYDWGGSVYMTTIYPSKAYELSAEDASDVALDADQFVLADDAAEAVDAAADGDSDDSAITVYYGDRISYDFRGTRTLSAEPVIYIPESDAMVPLPYNQTDLSRKHIGDLMEDAIDWHEQILAKIDSLTETVNTEIVRARLVALDMTELPFEVEQFYRYIGIGNDSICEAAAERARAFADPATEPTLWNLQLSLKLALLDNYQGAKASQTFNDYQELAGSILRYPATQLQAALEQHRKEAAADDEAADEPVVDDAQTTLAESLSDITDITGITETALDATDAQQAEQRVQQRLQSHLDE